MTIAIVSMLISHHIMEETRSSRSSTCHGFHGKIFEKKLIKCQLPENAHWMLKGDKGDRNGDEDFDRVGQKRGVEGEGEGKKTQRQRFVP